MNIALINGSPKIKNSASGILLTGLKQQIANTASAIDIGFHTMTVSEQNLEALRCAAVWVFAAPLYVDGIPSHLLSCLMQLEKITWQQPIRVYGIINCGFYEGIQAELALQILQNWCEKSGFIWSGGIGVGGGGALSQLPDVPNGHGPKALVDKTIQIMADNLLQNKPQENSYVSISFPRFLYQMAAQTGWRRLIRANGGKAKDLGKKPK